MLNQEGLSTRERIWAMFAIALAICISVLDSTIANIALPTIANDFDISPKNSIWIVNAYQLALVICLLPLSSIGDIYGYKKVYCGGLGVFCAASVCCAISSSLPALTLSRSIQGIGAAGILSVNAALIRDIYPPHQLGRGIGINAFIIAISAALGPTIAALILSIATWHWLFAINVPISIVALKIANDKLPESLPQQYPFDWPSAILCGMAFSVLIITIDSIGKETNIPQIISGLIFAAILLAMLVQRERKSLSPLLPTDLLRRPIFSLSLLTSCCSFVAQMAAYVSLPFFFIHVLNIDAVRTGYFITPWPLAIALSAPLAGYLSDRFPASILGALGLSVFAVGLFLLARLKTPATDLNIIYAMAVCGCGFGFFQAPNNKVILDATPRHRSGAAGGLIGTTRLLGQTIGATLTALMFGLSSIDSNRLILYVSAVIAMIAALLSLFRYRKPSPNNTE